MQGLVCTKSNMPFALRRSVFSDRNCQFVDRLEWNLCVSPDGLEVDEYDDDDSRYLVVHDGGNHLGSCRLRPFSRSTMLLDHFSDCFPEASHAVRMQKGRIYELTRFCRSPHISVVESRIMLSNLAVLLERFREKRNLAGFAAVVFPQVARFLDSIGVKYLVLSKSNLGVKTILLICITHAINPKLCAQEYREFSYREYNMDAA